MSPKDNKTSAELYAELTELHEKIYAISKELLHKTNPPTKNIEQSDSLSENGFKCRLCKNLTPNGVLITNQQGYILESNPAFFSMSGYAPIDLLGSLIDSFITPIPKNKDTNYFFEGQFNSLLKKKSGTYEDVSLHVKLLEDGSNIFFIQNITKIVESKNQLRQTLQYADNIFSSIFSGLFIFELTVEDELILVDGNAAAEKILNTSLDNITGIEFEQVWPESLYILFKEKAIEVAKTGKQFYDNELHFVEDSKERIFQINIFEIDRKRICISFNEITEQKQTEEKLHDSQNKLKVQNKISNAFIFEESDRLYPLILNICLKEFNSQYAFIGCVQDGFGLACISQKSIGAKIEEENFTFPNNLWSGIWEDILIDGKNILKNEPFIFPEADVVCDNLIASPVIGDHQLLGVLLIANTEDAYDQTQLDFLQTLSEQLAPIFKVKQEQEKRRLANEELIVEKNKVEAINKAKDEFLAVMSHELRTPLNPIIGFSKLLLEEIKEESLHEYVSIINGSGERLLKLIEDIFSLTRLTQGEIKAYYQKINLKNFLDECLQSSNAVKNRNTIQFSDKIKGYDDLNHDLIIETDYNLLSQIIRKLMNNACKYTSNGTITIRSATREKSSNNLLIRIEVSDNGIGIEEGLIDSLFDPFTQEESSFTRRFEGAGLGLAISQKLIEVLDGEIGAKSVKGEGSTFWIEFPAKVFQQIEETIKETISSQVFSKNYEILVAEDILDNQELIRTYLEMLSATVTLADDGLEALAIATEKKFDLVLMDLSMPFMDGFMATEKILNQEGPNQNTPIIALSAHVSTQIINDCKKIGMLDYISKPVSQDTLFTAIQKILK